MQVVANVLTQSGEKERVKVKEKGTMTVAELVWQMNCGNIRLRS